MPEIKIRYLMPGEPEDPVQSLVYSISVQTAGDEKLDEELLLAAASQIAAQAGAAEEDVKVYQSEGWITVKLSVSGIAAIAMIDDSKEVVSIRQASNLLSRQGCACEAVRVKSQMDKNELEIEN